MEGLDQKDCEVLNQQDGEGEGLAASGHKARPDHQSVPVQLSDELLMTRLSIHLSIYTTHSHTHTTATHTLTHTLQPCTNANAHTLARDVGWLPG